ncbi:MAG: hypothetical protein IPL82_02475 [Elusimicrobia bacterium]|nr:hypothetical protein [Elusimicrobiota bacterium]
MNTSEHITECYYRLVKNCFTLDDVKIIRGVNRQIDLLAINLTTGDQYHIETSVTHRKAWAPDAKKIEDIFLHKFLGVPKKREGKNSDFTKGANYRDRIDETYKSVGLDPLKIQRVFVCWIIKDKRGCDSALTEFQNKHGCSMSIVSFRDTVLPALRNVVTTANYDDEILRTLSFIKEQEGQTKKNKAQPVAQPDVTLPAFVRQTG